MNEQSERELMAGLKALAATTRQAGASPRILEAVTAEMARSCPQAPRFSRRLMAIAALLLAAIGGALWTLGTPGHNAPPRAPEAPEFVALPLAAALPQMESGSIVRVELPVASLPSYGIAIVPEMRAATVQAEFVVAQDGQPRAIRFVNRSPIAGSKP
jgi:hypothetical protein